jgi:hypothetical protein
MSHHRRIAGTLAVTAIGVCAFTAAGPLAQAQPYPNIPQPTQDSAEKTIADGYIAKQIDCTPDMPPVLQSINWYPPGFVYGLGGTGMITDENPALGGEFRASWTGSEWAVDYMYC